MGGRGAASGLSKHKYGTEYSSLLQVGNVKYVKNALKTSANAPLETKVKGRIYALIDKQNKVRSINFYGDDGKRYKRIDVEGRGHPGKDGAIVPTPHVQYGYIGGKNDFARKPNKSERKFMRKVLREWTKKT